MPLFKINFKKKSVQSRSPIPTGKYSHKLTKKKPVKRMKNPFEKFDSSFETKQLINYVFRSVGCNPHDVKFNNIEFNVNIAQLLFTIKEKTKSTFKTDIFIEKGHQVHFILPLTEMSPKGYFYKAFLEQMLPYARFTFLVTPKIHRLKYDNLRFGDQANIVLDLKDKFTTKSMDNLKQNLSKSLNIHDSQFVMLDYIYMGRTGKIINQALNELYNKEMNLVNIHLEDTIQNVALRVHDKDDAGKNAIPISQTGRREISEIGRNVLPKKLSSSNKRAQLEEQIMMYTFQYLGFEFYKFFKKSFESK